MSVLFKFFSDLFSRFPWHFIFLFGFMLLQTLLNAVSVIAIAPITDFLLQRVGDDASKITQYIEQIFSSYNIELTLFLVFIIFGCITITNGFVGVFTQYGLLRIKYDVLIHLLTDTLGQFFQARYLFFSQGDMGKLLNTFQQEVNKVGDNFGQLASFLANLLQGAIFLTVPFALNPKLTFYFLGTASLISAPLWLLGGITYKLGKRNTETSNVCIGVLHETLTASKLILGFGRQDNAVQRYRDKVNEHSVVSVKFQTLQRGISTMFIPLGMTAAVVSLYVAYLEGIPFSDMTMVMFSFLRLIPIIGLLIEGKTSIEGFFPAYEQLECLKKDASLLEEPRGGVPLKSLAKGLNFYGVSFSYPGRKPALKNISIEIKKGSTTAFVGKSGAGKTTVVDLMLGLYNQSDGKILLDGKDFVEYDLNSYRQKVGYVPQDPQLFNTTVRENMLWSSPEASDDDIWHACNMANAEQFVRELPDQLETTLGDRGVRLSGGQRQRLALARAIIRKPELLILDEATSALDTESEKMIQDSIEILSNKMTIVVIAHRLSTISKADYVYVLDKGKILEKGSYKDLTKKSGGHLSQMVKKQAL